MEVNKKNEGKYYETNTLYITRKEKMKKKGPLRN